MSAKGELGTMIIPSALSPATLDWALDLAYTEQSNYLNDGSPAVDFGAEWPAIARSHAARCREVGAAASLPATTARWENLALRYEADAERQVDVCIAGNPAANGVCGESDCVCACGASLGDGEGFNGLCGNCADRAEQDVAEDAQ
jgi:hypothetical protein